MASKILIIDDDESFIKILELRLKSFMPDLQATIFNNLGDARNFLKSLEKIDFDLVILDEHLPDGRGIEMLSEHWFEGHAVLMISSDTAPDMPGASVQAGAAYFLNKLQIKEPLFKPLVTGVMDRNRLQKELTEAKMQALIIDTVKTLVSTLRHEINNPLGAVLGAAYLMRNSKEATPQQRDAAELVESSGNRIKHVLDELCKAIALEPVKKAHQKVFHIPGDKPWE
jgi:response regulator of citrate/malate metabolism